MHLTIELFRLKDNILCQLFILHDLSAQLSKLNLIIFCQLTIRVIQPKCIQDVSQMIIIFNLIENYPFIFLLIALLECPQFMDKLDLDLVALIILILYFLFKTMSIIILDVL